MKQHASLSPSSSSRWLNCVGSLRVIDEAFPDGVPDQSSVYSIEGSIAHDAAEEAATKRLGLINTASSSWRLKVSDRDDIPEMEQHAEFYAETLDMILKSHPSDHKPIVLLEQKVDTGIEGIWGTSDAILLVAGHLYVVDYKYGMGVQVASKENTQMMLYALGALNTIEEVFGDMFGEIEHIHMVIVQPRTATPVSESETSRAELEQWAKDTVIPRAEQALAREGDVVPSEEACRWCPAAGVCATRAEAVIHEDFGTPPETLSPEELSEHLENISEIEKWCKDVREYSLQKMYEYGEEIPGFKSVLRNGRRTIKDQQGAIQALVDAGYPKEKISRVQTETLSKLEKTTGGPEELQNVLGKLLFVSEGKPAIAKAEDSSPSYTKLDSANQEFK